MDQELISSSQKLLLLEKKVCLQPRKALSERAVFLKAVSGYETYLYFLKIRTYRKFVGNH